MIYKMSLLPLLGVRSLTNIKNTIILSSKPNILCDITHDPKNIRRKRLLLKNFVVNNVAYFKKLFRKIT